MSHEDQQTKKLTSQEIEEYKKQLDNNWQVVDKKYLKREVVLDNFISVVEMVNLIAEAAEENGHHPDLLLHSYKRLLISLTTHSIGGITEKDIQLAKRVDELLSA